MPRWWRSADAATTKEFAPLKAGKPLPVPDKTLLDSQLREFGENPTLGIAAETIAAAAMAGEKERAREAAKFVLAHPEDASPLLQRSARAALGLPVEDHVLGNEDTEIGRIKDLLRLNPRNAALWVDLARLQAAKGGGKEAKKRARRSILAALTLAPNNRWVLRSANRFFLHIEEPDVAHRLLARHQRTRTDPWLMAAEIATAQILGVTPTSQKVALSLIRAKSLPPSHRSELYAACATSEMESGGHKFARRLFSTALENTTENAVAQAEWAQREMGDSVEVQPALSRVTGAFEAECWIHFYEGRLDQAFTAAKEWWCDEPFATNPVSMVCYLAGLREDFRTILDVTDRIIPRDPDDPLHRHNRIFALIASGEIFHGKQIEDLVLDYTIGRVRRVDNDYSHAMANIGMFLYRIGEHASGRRAYEASIEVAKRRGNVLLAINAGLYHAREAILQEAFWADAVLEEAQRLYKSSKRLSGAAIGKYLDKLAVARKDRSMAEIIRLQESAVQSELPSAHSWGLADARHIALPLIKITE